MRHYRRQLVGAGLVALQANVSAAGVNWRLAAVHAAKHAVLRLAACFVVSGGEGMGYMMHLPALCVLRHTPFSIKPLTAHTQHSTHLPTFSCRHGGQQHRA